MLDWSVLIVPLAVLAIILLLPFAGCGLEDHGESSGEPSTVETTVVPITLSWQTSATDIQTIAFSATVQPMNEADKDVGESVTPPGNSANGWPPKHLKPVGDVTVDATIPEPFVAKYRINATATVTQGAWTSVVFPLTLNKEHTFDGTSGWKFVLVLADGTWTLDWVPA